MRRRVIAWPKSLNEAERATSRNLKNNMHAHVVFDKASAVRNNGSRFMYAASLDFKKYYQQFELLVKKFWAFIANDRVYFLSTIPTGGVAPPLFSQALSRTLLAIAIRKAQVEQLVRSDLCIDSLRLMRTTCMRYGRH